ncbi:helix-turn-helix domain-containing protein [Ekhidna sp.]
MMSENLRKNQYSNTSRNFSFDGFNIRIVELTRGISELSLRGSLNILSIVQGGSFEQRKIPTVLNGGDSININENTLSSTILVLELNQNILEGHLELNQLELSFDLLKVYCELVLNPGFNHSLIEKIVRGLFVSVRHTNEKKWLVELIEILNGRWDEFPSLIDLASDLDVHPVTISKYFARICGMTISEYMRKIKVRRAVDMLLNSSETLVSIAFTCGFSDQSHMNRLVKRYIGHTPGAIRSTLS